MLEPRLLPKAPITEAVLEVQVKPRTTLHIPDLEKLSTGIMSDLGEVRRLNVIEGSFELQKLQPLLTQLDEQLVGFQFWSKDKKYVASCRKDRFSLSRLSPYTAWEDVFGRLRRSWERYASFAQPEAITRIAVRYINRIILPSAGLEFGDYLTSAPSLPEGFPQLTSAFLTRVVLHEREHELAATITQSLEGQASPDSVCVLLDIDAYKVATYGTNDATVWESFNLLRKLKNRIFFASITEKALYLFS